MLVSQNMLSAMSCCLAARVEVLPFCVRIYCQRILDSCSQHFQKHFLAAVRFVNSCEMRSRQIFVQPFVSKCVFRRVLRKAVSEDNMSMFVQWQFILISVLTVRNVLRSSNISQSTVTIDTTCRDFIKRCCIGPIQECCIESCDVAKLKQDFMNGYH